MSTNSTTHILKDEIQKWKNYSCLTLRPAKGKDNTSSDTKINYNHIMNTCIVFWKAIQNDIKVGIFKFSDKGKIDMAIDIDHFPSKNIAMVSFFEPTRLRSTGKGKRLRWKVWQPKNIEPKSMVVLCFLEDLILMLCKANCDNISLICHRRKPFLLYNIRKRLHPY